MKKLGHTQTVFTDLSVYNLNIKPKYKSGSKRNVKHLKHSTDHTTEETSLDVCVSCGVTIFKTNNFHQVN